MPETGFRFYGDLGEPVASVDVADLKSVWDMYLDITSQHPGGGVGVDSSLIERVCSPRADIRAVVYRCQMLSLLEMLPGDLLTTWKQSGQLQEAVLRVAARIPMNWMGEGLSHSLPFDVDAFFEEVRKESP
jgi:hypothetical protein